MKKYVCIWDLDGTLYEDEHHFDYYMNELAQFKSEIRDVLLRDYRAALAGRHALRLGRVYDVRRDLLLDVDGGLVRQA